VEPAELGITKLEQDRFVLARNALMALGVAVSVFALSYANGGFDTTTRAYAGISAWWLLGTGAAIGIAAARARIDRFALAAVGLLAAFALWTLISMAWASDKGRAFAQFDQVSLYVAVLAIAIVMARLVPSSYIIGGVALAISAIGGVALVDRFFPSTFGAEPSTILTTINVRLSFPLGYWNGLGIEVALAYPLLLSLMASRRSRVVSALAALPLPILAADMYLTSSRGAFVAAGVAVVAYLLLTPHRWPALAAAAVAGGAGAVAVAILVPRHALVNGATSTAPGNSQGHYAALVIGIACLVTAVVWLGLLEIGRRVPTPPRLVGWAVAGLLVVVVIAGIASSHPVSRFNTFRHNSVQYGTTNQTFVEQHLLTSSGSGRWQFWGAASSQFQAHPLNGGGAGSWQAWWLQHDTLGRFFTQFAHSLYLESLAELGIVGLLLIAGAVLVAAAGAIRSALELRSAEVAAAAAAGIAFFAAAAYDWVWQLAGIAVVGVGMLGVALGARPSTRAGDWGRFGMARPVLALIAVAAIVPQVVVLASGIHLENSQAAVRAGNGDRAKREALAAKAIEPWDAQTWLQLALVETQLQQYAAASSAIRSAISRSPDDYRLWEAAAQVDTYLGDINAVRADLAQIRRLNPNASILQSGA
jgi:O-Antigen ligase/Tetratricopeptide repeat